MAAIPAADFASATPPTQCGLALALPLDREAFFADLNAGFERDYVRGRIRGRRPELVWEEQGMPLAKLCNELAHLAAELGVEIMMTARLSDLANLFRACSVVTIVAHWRGATLVADDILKEPALFLEQLRATPSPFCRAIVERLIPSATERMLSLATAGRRAAALAELLNSIITSERPLPGCVEAARGATVIIDDLSLHSMHRHLLDEALPDLVRPGNRIELRDGFHSAEAVTSTVPRGWSGIIDFAICHSAYLAHQVKAGRPERRIITNVREVLPGIRLRIQKELYRRLAGGSVNYAEELMAIFIALQHTWLQPASYHFGRFLRGFKLWR